MPPTYLMCPHLKVLMFEMFNSFTFHYHAHNAHMPLVYRWYGSNYSSENIIWNNNSYANIVRIFAKADKKAVFVEEN